jgi:hypothetical protein
VDAGKIDLTKLETFWPKVLGLIGPMKSSSLQLAKSTAIFGPNTLAIRFSSGYTSAYNSCGSETGIESIRQALRKVTGQEWHVRVEIDATPSVDATPPARTVQWKELPLFTAAEQHLGATFLKADDGFHPLATMPTLNPDRDSEESLLEPDEG